MVQEKDAKRTQGSKPKHERIKNGASQQAYSKKGSDRAQRCSAFRLQVSIVRERIGEWEGGGSFY